MKAWNNYAKEERRMLIIIGVLLLAILLSFGRISSAWKKGFDFFYPTPQKEVNKDVQLNQDPENGKTETSDETSDK